MIEIKNSFIKKISNTTANAMGAHSVLLNGIHNHYAHAKKFPDSRCRFGIGSKENPKRMVKYSPTHEQVQSYLSDNREIVMELFLTQLIQEWYNFLKNIYTRALYETLNNNNTTYNMPIININIKIDFSLSIEKINDQIIHYATRRFDIASSDEKLKTIKVVLGQDLSALVAGKDVLAVNIKVRNILQHSSGIISVRDLEEIGSDSIEEDHGDRIEKKFVNQKITRTVYDIEKLTDTFLRFANVLVPSI